MRKASLVLAFLAGIFASPWIGQHRINANILRELSAPMPAYRSLTNVRTGVVQSVKSDNSGKLSGSISCLPASTRSLPK